MVKHPRRMVAVAAALALGLVGCGDDDQIDAPAEPGVEEPDDAELE